MTPIISLELVIEIHDNVIDISGGAVGVDVNRLVESQLSHDVLVKKLAYYIRFLVKNN